MALCPCRPNGRDYLHFTIVSVPSERFGRHGKLDRNWINECIAVNGRILKLLEVNLDESLSKVQPPARADALGRTPHQSFF
jgi:hypothetical protein